MKEFDETVASIIKKGNAIIDKRRARTAMIKRTSYTVSGICAAIIIGIGIWHNSVLKNADNDIFPEDNIIEEVVSDTVTTTQTSEKKTFTTSCSSLAISVSAVITSTSVPGNEKDTVSTNSEPVRSTGTLNTHYSKTTIQKTTVTITTSLQVENPNVPDWGNLQPNQVFAQFYTDEERYISAGTATTPEYIKGKKGEYKFSREIMNEDGQKIIHTLSGTIHSINNISDQAALAVKFEGKNEYYVYLNEYYSPQTLEQLIDDLDLNENIFTERAVLTESTDRKELLGLDKSFLWNALMTDISLKNSYDPGYANKFQMLDCKVRFDVYLPALNYNATVGLNEYGYFNLNLNTFVSAYHIGEDNTAKIFAYLSDKSNAVNVPPDDIFPTDIPENIHL